MKTIDCIKPKPIQGLNFGFYDDGTAPNQVSEFIDWIAKKQFVTSNVFMKKANSEIVRLDTFRRYKDDLKYVNDCLVFPQGKTSYFAVWSNNKHYAISFVRNGVYEESVFVFSKYKSDTNLTLARYIQMIWVYYNYSQYGLNLHFVKANDGK